MGKPDIVTKAYMRKSNIFADAFNYLIYNGSLVDRKAIYSGDYDIITKTAKEFVKNIQKVTI